MFRSLTGLLSAVWLLAVTCNVLGEDVNIDRKAMVNSPRQAMVNGVPDQPAPAAPEGDQAGNGRGASVYSPYRTHHGHSYYGPHYHGYGYRSSYYRSYPRYYGGYGYRGPVYGYGGPVFIPAGRLFGPAATMRFMYGW